MFLEITDINGNRISINRNFIIDITKKSDPDCAEISYMKNNRIVKIIPVESYNEIKLRMDK